MNTLTEREDIPSINHEGGWVDTLHEYLFADAAAARHAASVAWQVSPYTKEDSALPVAFQAFLAAFRGVGPGRAQLLYVRAQDHIVNAGIAVREDVDDEDVEDDEDVADGTKPYRSEQLQAAFGTLMEALGGLTRRDLADRLDAERRAKDLATLRERSSSAAELLAALEAAQGDLRRYEKVFVDALRLSVKNDRVQDGQRLEASKILARVADAKRP